MRDFIAYNTAGYQFVGNFAKESGMVGAFVFPTRNKGIY